MNSQRRPDDWPDIRLLADDPEVYDLVEAFRAPLDLDDGDVRDGDDHDDVRRARRRPQLLVDFDHRRILGRDGTVIAGGFDLFELALVARPRSGNA